MSRIFLSYRPEDTVALAVTGHIYHRLAQEFGPQSVFRDVDSIPLGIDFRTYLHEQVAKRDVLLAVIGRDWMKAKGRKGKYSLEDPGDFVRIEIEAALKQQIPVIPILVRGASIPPAEKLPQRMQDLPYQHGFSIRFGPDFHNDMYRLITYLKQQVCILSEYQGELATQLKAGLKEERYSSLVALVDMVKVSNGPFIYGQLGTREVIEYDYWIDKYPVTNEKYRAFIQANGYETEAYWSPDGWQWKTKNDITNPKYWSDIQWSKPDHPVVGVSFYEAEAYAKWAGKRLPTEQEWEKAARGEDGRWYPWGQGFSKKRCNSARSDLGHTTAVTRYPNGVSPYGCYDMVGNVWEWCSDWYDERWDLFINRVRRVVRGGCWDTDHGLVSLSVWKRDRYVPLYRYTDIGFRLVQDLP